MRCGRCTHRSNPKVAGSTPARSNRGATSIIIMLTASLAQMVEHLLCKVGLAEGTGFDPQRRQAFLSIFEILKRIW